MKLPRIWISFFERGILGLESETLFGKRDYKAARENFSFLIGRSVDIRYLPVIARFQIGLEPDIYIPEKAGFKGNAVYLDAAPEKDLIVRTRNTIDDTVYPMFSRPRTFIIFVNTIFMIFTAILISPLKPRNGG